MLHGRRKLYFKVRNVIDPNWPPCWISSFNNHFNEFAIIDLVENEVLHNKIGFVFQKLEINQIQNWPSAVILNFGFLHIFSSLFTLCSETFADKNSICRPFTTSRVYLPEKNRSNESNKTMI